MAFNFSEYVNDEEKPQDQSEPKSSFNFASYVADDAPAKPQEPGVLSKAWHKGMDGLEWVGNKYETYVTAPARAGVSAALDSKFFPGNEPDALDRGTSAWWKQFGEDPKLAPTGQEIAKKIGVPDVPFTNPKYVDDGHLLTGFPETPEDMAAQALNYARKNTTAQQAVGKALDLGVDPLLAVAPGKVIGGTLKGAGSLVKNTGALMGDVARIGGKGLDAMTGGSLGSEIVDAAGNSLRFGKQTLDTTNKALQKIMKPQIASDYEEMLRIAKQHGIPPEMLSEAIEFGPDSFIHRASMTRREGVLGQPYREGFEKGREAIQGAVDKQVTQLSRGKPLDPVSAGNALRDAFDKGVQTFWNGIDLTMNKVQQYAPGLMIDRGASARLASKVNSIEKYAKGLVARGIDVVDRTQGQYLLNAVEAIRNGNGSYKQTLEALQSIRQKAFSTKAMPIGQIPHDVEKMRDLYFATEEALIETVRKRVNPQFADEIIANNKKMTDFFRDREQIGHVLADTSIAPETAFKRVVMSGDTDQIAALRKILPKEAFEQLRGSVVNSLITRGSEGEISFKQISNAIRDNETRLKALFADNPQKLEELKDLMRLAVRYGEKDMSHSRTGASTVFHHIIQSLKEGVTNDQFIEGLKKKARDAKNTIEMQPAPAGAGAGSGAAARAGAGAPPTGPSRAPFWYAGKAAQAVGTSGLNPEIIELIRMNPRLLERVQDPNLRRALEERIRRGPSSEENEQKK